MGWIEIFFLSRLEFFTSELKITSQLLLFFFQVLPHEMNNGQHRLLKNLFVILGFSAVCFMMYIEPSQKMPSDNKLLNSSQKMPSDDLLNSVLPENISGPL